MQTNIHPETINQNKAALASAVTCSSMASHTEQQFTKVNTVMLYDMLYTFKQRVLFTKVLH